MSKLANVSEYMTTDPHSIGLKQTAKSAKELMSEHNFHHLPVKEAGKLVGFVSHRDIEHALAFEQKADSELAVEDVYFEDVYSVTSNTPLNEVCKTLGDNHYGCALVVDDGELVGIFTSIDACKVLSTI